MSIYSLDHSLNIFRQKNCICINIIFPELCVKMVNMRRSKKKAQLNVVPSTDFVFVNKYNYIIIHSFCFCQFTEIQRVLMFPLKPSLYFFRDSAGDSVIPANRKERQIILHSTCHSRLFGVKLWRSVWNKILEGGIEWSRGVATGVSKAHCYKPFTNAHPALKL